MPIESMSGIEFENLIATLIKQMGFEAHSTKTTGDGGIDIIAFNDQPMFKGKYIIQCKRWNGIVGSPAVRDLYGVVTHERANKGILITNSSFSIDAIKFASDKPIELIDGNKLINLLNQYNLFSLQYEMEDDIEEDDVDEIKWLRKEVRDYPQNIRARIKLIFMLIDEIFTNISTRKLCNRIKECEDNLLIITNSNPNPKEKVLYFAKYLSYTQLGLLSLCQGKVSEAVKFFYKITEYKCYSNKIVTLPNENASDSLNQLYYFLMINVVHLAKFIGAHETVNKIYKSMKSFYDNCVKHSDTMNSVLGKSSSSKAETRWEKELRIFFESDMNEKLIFAPFFDSEDLNDFVEEVDKINVHSGVNDSYNYAQWFILNIDNDIVNGVYKDLFDMDEESKEKQRKSIRAFL